MAIKFHNDLIQHTDEWRAARCGLLTASEMDKIITPAKLQVANNADSRIHLSELLAQRINKYVEPTWFGGDMERGIIDEIDARKLYRERYAPASECGFVTNDKFQTASGDNFTIGYSPDGLVDPFEGNSTDPGQIEVKSRSQKYQMQTILADAMPVDFLLQVQTGLLVTERPWCDFISYCSGMPMFTKRVYADQVVQDAIITAARVFEESIRAMEKIWIDRISDKTLRLIPTERRVISDELAA